MLSKIKAYEIVPGVMTIFPTSPEQAREMGVSRYKVYPFEACSVCGGLETIRFTKTDICFMCSRHAALSDYNAAVADDEPTSAPLGMQAGLDYYWRHDPDPHCGHSGKRTLKNKCWFCAEVRKGGDVSPRQIAIAKGRKWYAPVDGDFCATGHLALRRVHDGACSACLGKNPDELIMTQKPTPRQAALDAGEPWYTPADGDLCRKGHHAPRRVANGSCRACEQARRITDSAVRIDLVSPDLVLGRAAAQAMGFTVYRTGKPCKRKHTAWRWVSNSGCLECMKGV